MPFRLFAALNENIPKKMSSTLEKSFYDHYGYLLSEHESTQPFNNLQQPFDLIKAYIVIRGLLNKEKLESYEPIIQNSANLAPESMGAMHNGLPFFYFQGKKIYIPFFPTRLNIKYDRDLPSVFSEPLRSVLTDQGFESFFVDPFTAYGLPLFESEFTSLVPVMKQDNLEAFISLSFDTIFIISDQGTLEYSIPLFDSKLDSFDRRNLISRVRRALDPFFRFDREGFMRALNREGFISRKLLTKLEEQSRER